MRHDLSLGEVQSLALKATRGAGRSHGMAEEAAFAVRWLVERGQDGAGALATLLQATDGVAEGCPIATGAALSDAGALQGGMQVKVHCPLLLAPFLVALADAEAGVSLAVDDQVVQVGAGGIGGTDMTQTLAEVRIGRCASPEPCTTVRRADVDDATLQILLDFASRTYAPATEESRAKGAGAGVTDND
ncbi:DUF3726 domain-containing protein [Gymnodinialimonas hymeniacidonis]|uniref:DUF3726 domain-containing protein n=1 Tax=Gymnodinialimonas hymeniacidonis TaxID=3126508 RepID=UPI0034C6303A